MSDVTPAHLDKVLDGLAENPALPPEFIRRLFARRTGLGRVAKRPDLTDDLIREIIALDDHWLTHSLALNRGLPSAFRLTLAGHPDPSVRVAVVVAAEHSPRELFERLIGDTDSKVRDQLAQSDHVPADLRARLVSDPDPEIRATLARWWPQAPEEARRLLLTDPEGTVRAHACATYYARLPHPVPPADLIPSLLADPVTRVGAVRHCSLDADTARRLAEDPDEEVRIEVAAHSSLPPSLRDVLAEDTNPRVMLRIFARRDTPESTRSTIHAHLLANASPKGWLADLEGMDDNAVERHIEYELARTELGSLRLPWVTADPLPHVDSPYTCFRASAAESDTLPPSVVARLLDDKSNSVRTTMARHARDQVDAATAERLERTYPPTNKIRWRPADDFPLPPSVLRRLATDPDPRMRELSPRDPDLPLNLIRRLVADPESSVRREIAAHPGVPPDALAQLVADESGWVAAAAAANPGLPLDQMDRILGLAGL
ncbi:hypothetical protein SRB5_27140 [Streptomyces sp. RB5]|uniref:Leucine rich repeat variant n=1 Tax=Streptomyces smaragdinus TaxID=2585196 RepID=A0A7K0CGK9_9ACTN|nr:hypothetical protein [Streptomyces smaragdinus]MQY12578.1 hypothetical protein [Streptomyces smaragdinus]